MSLTRLSRSAPALPAEAAGGSASMQRHAPVQGKGAHIKLPARAARVRLTACVRRDAVHEEDPIKFHVQPMGTSFTSSPGG